MFASDITVCRPISNKLDLAPSNRGVDVVRRAQHPAFTRQPGFGQLKRALADGEAFAFPEHIRRDIERQQEAGEIIVGWTQVAAIVFFAVVYAISPKAFPAGTPFEPVLWTLGIYGLFTAGRLVLAYRGRLSRGLSLRSRRPTICRASSRPRSRHRAGGPKKTSKACDAMDAAPPY